MKNKTLFRRWQIMVVSLVLIVATLGITAIPASAGSPPPPLVTANMVVKQDSPTSYLGIYLNGGPQLQGWCVEDNVYITVNKEYPAEIYDYFGKYYPSDLDYLPAKVKTFNWFAIAYIINNKLGGNVSEVQLALHYYMSIHYGNPAFLAGSPKAQAIVAATEAYLAANGGVFVPGPGQMKPIICFVSNTVQTLFFEYSVPSPPPPPIPELPAGALLGIGLVTLGGFAWLGYRRNRVSVRV